LSVTSVISGSDTSSSYGWFRSQGSGSIAIGLQSGQNIQGQRAVAIGNQAGTINWLSQSVKGQVQLPLVIKMDIQVKDKIL
jgi:hypothetical protein